MKKPLNEKPHVVKERTKDMPVTGDLRGLGYDPVLKETEPYAFAAIHGLEHGHISKIAHTFELDIEGVGQTNTFMLRTKNYKTTTPKEQSVFLLGASLMLCRTHTQAKIYLDQASGLHIKLDEAINSKQASKHSHERMIANWLKQPHHFSMGAAIQLNLSHAGFSIIPKEEMRHFEHHDLEALHREFAKSLQASNTQTDKQRQVR